MCVPNPVPNTADSSGIGGSRGLSVSSISRPCDDGDAALAAADEALALDEKSGGARYLRGRGLALVGRLDEAMAEMTKVLAADPENADAQNAVAMLERAGVRKEKH